MLAYHPDDITCTELTIRTIGGEAFLSLFSPSSKPASEVLNEYSRKVDFLKGMLQAEKLVSRGPSAWSTFMLTWGLPLW